MSPWAQRILSHDWNQRFCCLNPWNPREKVLSNFAPGLAEPFLSTELAHSDVATGTLILSMMFTAMAANAQNPMATAMKKPVVPKLSQ